MMYLVYSLTSIQNAKAGNRTEWVPLIPVRQQFRSQNCLTLKRPSIDNFKTSRQTRDEIIIFARNIPARTAKSAPEYSVQGTIIFPCALYFLVHYKWTDIYQKPVHYNNGNIHGDIFKRIGVRSFKLKLPGKHISMDLRDPDFSEIARSFDYDTKK